MAEGLLAAAISGFGKAFSNIGEAEAKKQNEAKLRKELMAMESEERLRIDEIMHERKMARLPKEAVATAEANVAGEAAGLKAASAIDLPTTKAKAAVASKTAQYAAEDEVNLTGIEAEREAKRLKAGFTAKTKEGVPQAEAGYEVSQREEKAKAIEGSDVLKTEANIAAQKRLEDARALVEKNVAKEEADLFAKQELAKIQAMTSNGVPEAEAKLLAAKWKAGKTQRDEAAAEKTQQEITDAITRAGNKKYLSAERSIAATKHFASGGGGTSEKERVSTADLSRKVEAAEKDLADALGVVPNKVNEKLASLKRKADSGDANAKQTLADVQALRDNVKKRRADLQNWRDKPEPEEKTKTGKNTVKKPGIETFNR